VSTSVIVAEPPKSLIEQLEARRSFITIGELAVLLGESHDTIYRRAKRGVIPHIRVGLSAKFDPLEIAAWLRKQHVG
jgi:excisionase family DNA binding protein